MTFLTRFQHAGDARLGVTSGDDFIDVSKAYAGALVARGESAGRRIAEAIVPPDALAFFQHGDRAIAALAVAVEHAESLDADAARAAGIRVPRAAAEILVPIPNPPKIICVGRNYGKHANEIGMAVSEVPILFSRFAATQVAHGKPVVVPTVSDELDWEGELTLVIGEGGRHIPVDSAMAHIAGYTIFNDVTVRDYQFRVSQYTEGKNFHASGPVGPHIALAGSGLDPSDLAISTTVNGVVKQEARTSELIFDIPTLIHHISTFIELEPGDLVLTGTPGGVGFTRTPPEFLRDGDVVEVTVEGIGTLSNPVIQEQPR